MGLCWNSARLAWKRTAWVWFGVWGEAAARGGGEAEGLAFGEAVVVGLGDAGGEHGEAGGGAGEGFELLAEGRCAGYLGHKDEAGFSAELAGAEGEGAVEAAGFDFGVGGERAGQDEDGVDAAHLGEAGDGGLAGGGEVHESAAAALRPGEGDGADGRVLYEGFADAEALVVEHGEDARGEAGFGDGRGDDGGDELAGAGVGGVGFYDDGIAGGERGGGVAAGGREGQREVAGAEDGDGAEREEHGTEVGPRKGFAVG